MQNIWVWVVVAIIVVGGGYWWWQSSQTPAMSDDGTPTAVDAIGDANTQPSDSTSATPSTGAGSTAPMTATVTYNGSSFSPSEVTIKKGGTVTFTSTGDMWVASGPHPAHSGYSGTNKNQHCPDTSKTAFDQCAPGSSYSFTFQKAGTWPYHDHLNAGVFGKIIVVE